MGTDCIILFEDGGDGFFLLFLGCTNLGTFRGLHTNLFELLLDFINLIIIDVIIHS